MLTVDNDAAAPPRAEGDLPAFLVHSSPFVRTASEFVPMDTSDPKCHLHMICQFGRRPSAFWVAVGSEMPNLLQF
jgi:hypothetical protein